MPDLSPLRDKSIAITGRLASMTREDAVDLIQTCGGRYRHRPARDCAYLVVGQEGWPLQADGHLTGHLRRAHRLQDDGASLQIVEEQEFLELARLSGADAAPELQTLYTTTQLARILDIPGSRIRRWVRRGLLQAARTELRLEYFDFRQVAAVKLLQELHRAGVPAATLRESLAQLARWFPDDADGLVHLRRLVMEDRLLIRLEDGTLAESTGQLRLPFAEEPTSHVEVVAHTDEPRHQAQVWEDDGDLTAARDGYRDALELDPSCSETWFNLGNVLYAMDDKPEAVVAFQEAVELDDRYVEAWNNLASVLADLEEFEDALVAGRRAVALAPDYVDAHYNLAQAYCAIGREDRARVHAEVYFRFDRASEWAQHLRTLLERAGV